MGEWNIPLEMTHIKKTKDLLYFKGDNNNLKIKLESSKKVENADIFNIIVSIYK